MNEPEFKLHAEEGVEDVKQGEKGDPGNSNSLQEHQPSTLFH
jgi:hypothetical protein